jgi:hypothetical protein
MVRSIRSISPYLSRPDPLDDQIICGAGDPSPDQKLYLDGIRLPDLLVLIVVLNKIINTAEKEVLEKIKSNWAGEDDIFTKVKEIVALTNELSAQIPRAIYNFMKNK